MRSTAVVGVRVAAVVLFLCFRVVRDVRWVDWQEKLAIRMMTIKYGKF
jgi:hypothetical protein